MLLGMGLGIQSLHQAGHPSLSVGQDVSSPLLLQCPACPPASVLPEIVMDSPLELYASPQLNVFFYKLHWSRCLFTEIEQKLRHRGS